MIINTNYNTIKVGEYTIIGGALFQFCEDGRYHRVTMGHFKAVVAPKQFEDYPTPVYPQCDLMN